MSVIRCASVALALVLASLLSGAAQAQIMRFETSVGSFDMELNPNNDPNLQPIVDNVVAYIGLGRYHYTVINRAAEDFVLQMGQFLGFPPTPNEFIGLIQDIRDLNPVVVDSDNDGNVDFTTAASNTRGTVSLALSSGPNTGTSSFFINLGDNSQLDSGGFVPFARIVEMSTIDKIMALQQIDLTGTGSLTFKDTPLLENGRLVILKSVHVLQAAPGFSFVGPVQAALQQIQQASASSAIVPAVVSTPEPSSAALAAIALVAAARTRAKRRR